MTSETTYSMEDVVVARMALRRASGETVNRLNLKEFVDAICGEVDMLRNAGLAEDEIVAILERALGRPLDVEDLRRC